MSGPARRRSSGATSHFTSRPAASKATGEGHLSSLDVVSHCRQLGNARQVDSASDDSTRSLQRQLVVLCIILSPTNPKSPARGLESRISLLGGREAHG